MARKRRGKRKPGARGRGRVRPIRSVGPDMCVRIAYRLYDADGELVDEVKPPGVPYIHGFGQIVPGLETGLVGAMPQEQRSIELAPEDAFGERDDAGVLEVDRDELAGPVSVGDEVIAQAPDGEEVSWRVSGVEDERVLLDVNHPLAGQRVRFEVTVLDVRPATEQQLEEARAEVDERLVDDQTIVYASDRPEDGEEREPVTAGAPGELIPLRRRPQPPTSREDEE